MKIVILSRKPSLYSTQRLLKAAETRGHDAEVINPLRCYMSVASDNPLIHYKERSLENVDAVIPRIGSSITFYGTAVVRQFEMIGTFALNESVAISRARDKLRSLQLLTKKGIGLPLSGFAHSTEMTKDLMNIVGKPPVVIKLLEGTQGKGIVLAETQKAAESVIEAFKKLDAHFLVQEFISESKGSDIRCIVLGGKVIASMQRQAMMEGEFRSNLHRGGVAKAVEISETEATTAIKAAHAMGLGFAGVDLIRSKRGPLVLEVNSSPGLEGIEKSTNKDIASLVIEYIEKNYKDAENQNRTKGRG